MEKITMAYEQLIERFTQWAENEENVRAVIVIGSRARQDHPADAWSDLDVFLFADDPEPYWTTTTWLFDIGAPWLAFVEPTPDGQGVERRVLFEGGLDVDIVPCPVTDLQTMLDNGFPPDVADMVRRGIRFLVDKDGYEARLQGMKIAPPSYTPPSESEFLNVVNDFWYHTVWTAKHLRRGEIWWAKSCCDSYLKHLLRHMLEWHAHAAQGAEVDTWMRGRFLEEWADPRALAALPQAFAHYNAEDIWRALQVTMDLFRWLATETADLLEHPYPTFGATRATELVARMFSERTHP